MFVFLVAIRCRDPFIRRRAITLLLRERRREGVWDSFAAARVAAEIVNLEEGLTGDLNLQEVESGVTQPFQIPRENRMRMVMPSIRMEEGKIELMFSMGDGSIRGPSVVEM